MLVRAASHADQAVSQIYHSWVLLQQENFLHKVADVDHQVGSATSETKSKRGQAMGH